MNHHLAINIVIGLAVTGVVYYLWKQEQAPPPATNSSWLDTAITGAYSPATGQMSGALTALEGFGGFFF